MRHIKLAGAVTLLVGALFMQYSRAQDFPLERRKGFAFNPAPQSECSWHAITEMSVLYQLNRANPLYYRGGTLFSWQLGFMANTSRNQSWGGALQLGIGDERGRLGVGPVYRHWMQNRAFFDVSAGLILAAEEDGRGISENGWFIQTGAGLAGKVSLITRVEWLNLQHVWATDGGPSSGGRTTLWYGGVNVGGTPGAVFCAVSAVTATVVLIALAGHRQVDYIAY